MAHYNGCSLMLRAEISVMMPPMREIPVKRMRTKLLQMLILDLP
jgi:hypothetical protein